VFEEEEELKTVIAEYEEKRNEYSEEVSRLKTAMELNQSILKSFKDKEQFIHAGKLDKVIKKILAGENIESINLAKRGAGFEYFFTLKRVEGLIE
jgi:hypothetical protein